MTGIVDRIEGKYYVIEIAGVMTDVPQSKVAAGVKPGHAVVQQKGVWVTDATATKERESRIKRLMKDVWADE
ncbi:Protein of unknown function [Paenibacillus sp. 1_12]|uniref:DUF3006 domain-containing protein n=1 Tax=Paenibacillus sp. 1_12 TaxID=1566278 RepID=UPI0008E857E9|nr:DUF3006 domain-containing protein [Paenibacillus sp. 1_12]SFK75268.1 Protein of unknown function [Paenibacillus sp. 1_12]